MIWFHLVSLNYWKQQFTRIRLTFRCCDLISSCIFELLKTTCEVLTPSRYLLWFDFILYLWIIENNSLLKDIDVIGVVIWFHLVSLNYWKQQKSNKRQAKNRCDLISSCIFELLKTTYQPYIIWLILLWFDFILYLWIIENNDGTQTLVDAIVVIWFHLVSLNYWKQQFNCNNCRIDSCDLISSCIFELLKTTQYIGWPKIS